MERKPKIENRKSRISTILFLGLILTGHLVKGGEPLKAPFPLPDVRAVVAERGKAVARIECFEYYVPGLFRRSVRLLNPFPIHETVEDALAFTLYVPSLIVYPLRKHLGSGVLIDADGYVLTNHHVIRDSDRITVRLTDSKDVRRKFTARLVGRDPHADIALLKIDPGKAPLVTAPLGDSDQLALGDWIIAVGNPMNLTGSVSVGVVAGLHRQLGALLVEDHIQVDAPLNPGNSGGPLLNAKGEVVGLVALGVFPANSIGFAIPTGLVTPYLDDLKRDGRPHRGYLGVSVREITPDLAKEEKLDAEEGLLVNEVALFSPAGRAGLEEGDIIQAAGGKAVRKAREFHMTVLRSRPGSTLPITVLRERKTLDVCPKLGERRTPLRIF